MLFELVSAFLIFLVLIISTLIPYFYLFSRGREGGRSGSALALCNCVACGIFLSTCFLGLIPHVRIQEERLRGNNSSAHSHDQKEGVLALNTEMIVLLGFLLILVVEQMLTLCTERGDGHSHLSPNRSEPTLRKLLDNDAEDGEPLVDTTLDTDDDGMDIVFRSSSPLVEKCDSGHSHSLHIEDGITARTMFLLLGLSIHSAFEGIALGVQKEKYDFFNILVAIMFHEVLCCFAYGVSLAQQRVPVKSAVLTSIVLAATIPIGMMLAVIAQQIESANAQYLQFVLEGLAAGTFVYVACVEMLGAELGHSHNNDKNPSSRLNVLKAVSVCIGVGIFWGLQMIMGRHHG